MHMRLVLLFGFSCFSLACRSNAPVVEQSQHVVNDTAPIGWIDSVVSIEEALRQFRADIPEQTTQFTHGAKSRDALMRQFADAVKTQDTASLTKLVVSQGEFAYLYYPNHPQSKPPYELSPQLMWFQMTMRSEKGLRRLLRDFGGQQILHGYSCADSLEIQNGNKLWTQCVIQLPLKEQKQTVLFSGIIEKDGIYKILSYSNSL